MRPSMRITSLTAAATLVAASLLAVPLAVLPLAVPATALDDGLARTPQLGWNAWNTFGCGISDTLIRQMADAMVASGMAAAGYEYVNLDDCWSTRNRDASGNLVADPDKFPNGIKALADHVHAKGLKLGIYSSAGTTTCSGYPGSLGHETQDAKLWASWGIDYLKYDYCGDSRGISGQTRYITMRDALKATGRPILYSLCNWGQDSVWTWGANVGHSWRTTGDITDSWSSVMGILDQQVGKESYAGPGGWNDPDMLEVGNGGLSQTESRAHFSLWALLNAPLLAGNDLRTMSQSTIDILTDPDVLAVNQDWGGKQGFRLRDDGDAEVWAKPMSDGSVAVALLNRGSGAASISVTASALGLGGASSYSVRDLWADTTSTSTGPISATVTSHGVAFLRVSGGGVPTTTTRPPTTTTTTTTTRPPTTTTTTTTSSGGGGRSCTATYRVIGQWPGGFQGEVTVTAGSAAISGWTTTWSFSGGQTVTNAWSSTLTSSGSSVTATNAPWNGALAATSSTTFGFIGAGDASTAVPAVTCTAA